MASGLVSGISSGLGSSLGTSAAGSAAGTAAASTAASTTAGQIGSALGSAIGSSANSGMAGDALRLFDHGDTASAAGATGANELQGSAAATDPSKSKGGWLGTGLFGNDQYNPNPSSYAPATGTGAAQAAMPKPKLGTSIALSMLGKLPLYS